ncbi:XRE family transcriptional regulator [Lactococcus petauri]|uniref:XRE family transcriptional regulator n=1 Tax=Lactococcus petauri TaxID=1940789 RepID=UPI0022E5B91A|nr:XRE family transcriptional regulator [Lactococcus petauri]
MTKTKLQIMREKEDMTIEQVAIYSLMIQAVDLHRYYRTLENFDCSVSNTVEVMKKCEKWSMDRSNENWKYIAQALGCSVDELVEE